MTAPPPPGMPGYGPGYGPGPNTFGPGPYAGPAAPYPPGSPYPPAQPAPYSAPHPATYPSPQGFYGPPGPNPNAYTPWIDRVLASVIDQIPIVVIFFVGYGILMATMVSAASSRDAGEEMSGPVAALVLLMSFAMFVAAIAYPAWNYGYRQGTTGQSIGKKVMKFKVVSEKTGQPIGFGLSLLRQIAHILDGFLYIGYLMPLWDAKRQTIADKLMTTVCLPAPVPAPVPGAGPPTAAGPYPYPPR
ncbi:RDD family protein [Mycobacterium sp. TNTM28]|uniref:RDD family protein n=1 Tax=[Mycobacterium] fortunisiensis TaxID=2600579 RepID=A0ABS6KSC7_9MYCO|nr:RDD family protein [[Mycobacterium] fortunisiensis]MBU9766419.1 RDD family protein [[Mycobacterium] fortunisiensis]